MKITKSYSGTATVEMTPEEFHAIRKALDAMGEWGASSLLCKHEEGLRYAAMAREMSVPDPLPVRTAGANRRM